MKETTYEGTAQGGHIVLPKDVHIPDNTRVYVVVPASNEPERVRIISPRLLHRDEAGDFTMKVELEGDDARL